MLAFGLLNLINTFYHRAIKQYSIAQGQIHVTLCSTYVLNNKNYNTYLLNVSINYDRKQIGGKVQLSHNTYDWTHIQNDNALTILWYLSNPNGLVEITDIIKFL